MKPLRPGTERSPVNLFTDTSRCVNLVHLQSCAGNSPTGKVNVTKRMKVLITGTERTCQRAMREVELYDIVAKLANIRWKCEASVASQSNVDSLCLHANHFEGQLACACTPRSTQNRSYSNKCEMPAKAYTTLTLQFVVAYVEGLQILENAPGLRQSAWSEGYDIVRNDGVPVSLM